MERVITIIVLTVVSMVFGGLSASTFNLGASLGYGMLCVGSTMSAVILILGKE